MTDKIFGEDFVNETNPTATSTVSVNNGTDLVDVQLQYLYKALGSPSIQALLDLLSSTRGSVLYRGSSGWDALIPGTAGKLLMTNGADTDPSWELPGNLAIASQAQGDILYFNGTSWVRLAAGTSGQFLKTLGTGANPAWATVSAGSSDPWTADANTWTYASADSPTFTLTVNADVTDSIGVGYRIKLTQTTVKYFIVTAISYSSPNTTITLYGGTDYTLANAAISSPYYSPAKVPFGFPVDPNKWTVTLINDASQRVQLTPTTNTWYNLGSLTGNLPIGAWNVRVKVIAANSTNAGATASDIYATLSTANNSESDSEFTGYVRIDGASGSLSCIGLVSIFKSVVVASKTAYYLNAKWVNASSSAAIQFMGQIAPTVVKAACAYL